MLTLCNKVENLIFFNRISSIGNSNGKKFLFNYNFWFDSNFGQLLTLYNVKSYISIVANNKDKILKNNKDKIVKNLIGYIENIAKDQNNENDKNKLLKNLISDKYASINIDIILKTDFFNKAIKIFTK